MRKKKVFEISETFSGQEKSSNKFHLSMNLVLLLLTMM